MATEQDLASKKRAITLFAREKMAEHGLQGWRLEWDNARNRAGVCRSGAKTIGLSQYCLERRPLEETRDTVLHEIAHALAGPRHGHDAHWKMMCRRVGANPNRTYETSEEQKADAPWKGTCPRCARVATRHQQPVRVNSCGKCTPGFNVETILEWEYLGRPMPYYRLHPKYVAEYNRVMARRAEPQRHATEAELWAALEAGERAASAPRRTPSGATAQSIPVILAGDRVQLTRVRGHQSVKATVVKVGRTRYHVRFDGGAATYTVPMGAVDKI
jgi:predicted SprT family Zn-dependent metalloprotease